MTTHRIGLVEDDERTRHALSRVIEQSPGFVLWFESGTMRGACEWMRQCAPGDWPEVWLIDLGLPDGSGLEVIREAVTLQPGSHVMVVSVFGDETKVLDSIAAGASGYILKGQSHEELLLHMRDLLNGGSPMSPLIARQLVNRMRHQPPSAAAERRADLGAAGKEARGDPQLTPREQETLGMSANTVRHHIRSIYAKLGVHSKMGAVNEARRRKLLAVE